MLFKTFELLKFRIIRFIEANPKLNLLIYNNVSLFKFLLPHEKDFYGMLKVCKNKKNLAILDIGANLGISSMGFRKLGFVNKIYAFEPNYYLYKNYLKKINKNYQNIFIKNFALGNKNQSMIFYMPYYKSECIHYCCSFDKKYLLNTLKMAFPKIYTKVIIKEKIIKCKKFDDINFDIKPHFIKIDTEGYDSLVLRGLKKTISIYKPIILVEYNKEYFREVKKILSKYTAYIYDIENDKMLKLNKKIINNKVARTSNKNSLSIRNIYFLPKKYKFAQC